MKASTEHGHAKFWILNVHSLSCQEMLSVGLPRWLTSPCTPCSCRPQSALKALSTQTLEHLQSLQTAKRVSRGTDEGAQHQQKQEQGHLTGPDISRLAPHLQREWDHEANACLGSIVISPTTDRKVWWASGMCKSGQLHRWQATVKNRSNGRGCPYATGKKASQCNNLAHNYPRVAAEWDWEANAPRTPATVTAACHDKVAWRCRQCKHGWSAKINDRTVRKSGCPVCGRQAGRLKTRQPSIAAGASRLLQEWDYAANDAEGWHPDSVSLMSAKKVHWIRREECRLGMLHKWQAPPYRRIAMNQGSPFPHGKAVCACNSLAVQCPDAAKRWDSAANGDRTPENVTVGSNEVMHWMQPDGKRWQQQVVEVVNNLRRQQRSNTCLD